MPQPTPLVQEINRLMRVDRAARELAASARKQIGAERIEAWRDDGPLDGHWTA